MTLETMAIGRLLLLLDEENGVVLLEDALLRSFFVELLHAVEVFVDAEALLLLVVLLF